MRKTIALSLLLVLLYSCKKDNLYPVKNEMAGSWELRSSYNFSFNNYYAPGNGKIIRFGNVGSFERRNHDTLVFKGQYWLSQQKACYGKENEIVLTTSEAGSPEMVLSVRGDTLSLGTSNCLIDGGGSTYIRN